jgi:hypothetical protein
MFSALATRFSHEVDRGKLPSANFTFMANTWVSWTVTNEYMKLTHRLQPTVCHGRNSLTTTAAGLSQWRPLSSLIKASSPTAW